MITTLYIVLLAILLMFVVVAGAWFLFSGTLKKDKKNTDGSVSSESSTDSVTDIKEIVSDSVLSNGSFPGTSSKVAVASNNNEEVINFEENGICYNVIDRVNKTVEVAKGKYTGSIVIPETVVHNDVVYSVTSIVDYAFIYCSGLTSITIPNSVASIGECVFYDCYCLKEVHISDLASWCNIDFNDNETHNPLYYAHNLYLNGELVTELVIPDGVSKIKNYAFYGCSGLTSIKIPNSVTSIGSWAFSDCIGLTSITIPNSVTSIGESAFWGCSGLTSITMGNSVKSIGESAFYECNGLTSITIPNSVTSIGEGVFSDCSGLTSIIVDKNNPKYDSRYNCNAIIETETNELIVGCQNTVVPGSVTSIGECAFYECNGLTSITIPNSVASIGDWAFFGCEGLTSITITNSVTSIGESAFYRCSGLTSITIPNSVTSIGNRAFWECRGLTNIPIPNSVIKIGEEAFDGCSGLTSITIPNSVTSIGGYAFRGCTGLTSIIVDKNNPKYDSRYDCNAIIETETNELIVGCQNTVVPGSVTSIGDYAFRGCTGLTSIIIPNSVTSIGESAFNGCKGLTSITIGNSVTSIGDYAFFGCSGLENVIKPDGVSIGKGCL